MYTCKHDDEFFFTSFIRYLSFCVQNWCRNLNAHFLQREKERLAFLPSFFHFVFSNFFICMIFLFKSSSVMLSYTFCSSLPFFNKRKIERKKSPHEILKHYSWINSVVFWSSDHITSEYSPTKIIKVKISLWL